MSNADYNFLPIVLPPALYIKRQIGITSYKTLNFVLYFGEATLLKIP
jgi:hypothetical protein